jgi:fumarate reductase subunit C
MIIVNFVLFLCCVFFLILSGVSLCFGIFSVFIPSVIFFCIAYYAFRLDHTKVSKPKEMVIILRNEELQNEKVEKAEDDDDWTPYFDRTKFEF